MNSTFCYQGRDNLNGDKLFGGMIHAGSMEDAARRLVRRCKLKVRVRYLESGFPEYRLEREDGRKVNLYVSVHPENIGMHSEAIPE